MQKATISQLKNRLSAYLERVRAGETVLILDRDQPIARLERVSATDRVDDRLGRLERSGVLKRGTTSVPLELLKSPAPKPQRSVLQALLEDRAEGR